MTISSGGVATGYDDAPGCRAMGDIHQQEVG